MISQDSLTGGQWAAVQRFIEKVLRQRGREIDQVVVTRNDKRRRVVWASEYGDQPIPIIAFDYHVKTYDYAGPSVQVRELVVKPKVPEPGDTILVARHLGSARLPKCLGIIQSVDFVDPGLLEDE